MKKRAVSFLITFSILAALLPKALAVDEIATTSRDPPEAEIVEDTVAGEEILPDPDSLPDNDELFAAYVQREFERGISGGISLCGTAAGDRLAGLEKAIYDDLKAKIKNVAGGSRASTQFSVSADLSSLSWTKEELGVSTIVSGSSITAEAKAAVAAKFKEAVNTTKLMRCLLADCPYELYWFDKTAGMSTQYGMSSDGTSVWITGITVCFAVAADYAGSQSCTADTGKTGATATAIANAKAIVTANAGKTDREKLEAYRAKICELVSYNSSAAAEDVAYGDPWQLIYVFDGNADTNVVCEGYSKAFQYLCDLSEFTGDVVCYTVSGTMSGGAHMWNVVKLEERNLLVDVTNCDSGTIGADTKLFLVAVAGTDSGRTHTFTIGSASVVYTYDESQKDLFCSGYLELTPDTGSGTIQLRVASYDTAASTVIGLYQNGVLKKSTLKLGTRTGQLLTNVWEVTDVPPGIYDLVVSKNGCLTYTVEGVTVTAAGVDLTGHSDPAISTITLLAGDVNGDGMINYMDMFVLLDTANYDIDTGSAANSLTDVDGDGMVNYMDLFLLLGESNYGHSEDECQIKY